LPQIMAEPLFPGSLHATMRRLVLVLVTIALLCQGVGAAVRSGCRFPACCDAAVVAASAIAQAHEGRHESPEDAQAPCDAPTAPCDGAGDACHCQGPVLCGLLIQLPAVPMVAPGVISSGVYLRPLPEPPPDNPLRPPHGPAA
jgi:hypothetical protein